MLCSDISDRCSLSLSLSLPVLLKVFALVAVIVLILRGHPDRGAVGRSSYLWCIVVLHATSTKFRLNKYDVLPNVPSSDC